MHAEQLRELNQLESHRLLFVDPSDCVGHLLQTLNGWGFDTLKVGDPEVALHEMEMFEPIVVIYALGSDHGQELRFVGAAKRRLDVPIIVIATDGTIDSAVFAIKEGAFDYLSAPIDLVRLRNILKQAIDKASILEEIKRLRMQLKKYGKFRTLTGKSGRMQELFYQIELAAPSDAAVIISGPSGSGKELVARAIHDMSPRRKQPFIAINCAAIPSTLLESEIFGYEKGAFTGATQTKEGCFELADRGTLFLDEIVDMAPDLQSKLLRLLESGRYRRVGGRKELHADVRIVAASNSDFQTAISDGRLREDLFYRLNVFNLILPALRERLDDLPLLVRHFISEFNNKNDKQVQGVDETAMTCLRSYGWPGNVRELKNVIERAVIICRRRYIGADDLPDHLKDRQPQTENTLTVKAGTPLRRVEEQLIHRTLEMTKGNKTRAAKLLGLSVKTLHNKLHQYREK